MPRARERLTLESGPRLDLAEIVPRGAGKPGTLVGCFYKYSSGAEVTVWAELREQGGTLRLSYDGREQRLPLVADERHFGGRQWYVICPRSGRKARVLYRPLGAQSFSSRHAWGKRAAYASQFLDPVGRAWHTKAKVKARLLGDANPDEWDLPPKPKRMRLATYERWEAKFDQAEDTLNDQCLLALARLMGRL